MPWVSEEKGRWVPEKSGMSHSPPSQEAGRRQDISRELGYDNVDWTTEIKGLERADIGLSENVENKMAKIRNYHPDYNVRNFDGRIMVQPPKGKWHPLDSPDTTMADVSDFSGEAIPLATSMGALALGPPGVIGGAISAGLGTIAGRYINAGIDSSRGYPVPEDIHGKALQEGAIDTAFGLAGGSGGKLYNMFSGRGLAPPHDAIRSEYKRLYDYLGQNPDMPGPLVTQVTQPGQVVNRIGQQANAVSVEARNRLTDQQVKASEKLRSLAPDKTAYRLGSELQAESAAAQGRITAGIVNRYKAESMEQVGAKTKEGLNLWLGRKKNEINAAYNKVDSIASKEQPIFNLAPAKQEFQDIGVYGMGNPKDVGIGVIDVNGKEFVKQIWPLVNAAETPGAKLKRVGEILSKLDDTQDNWRVIKELRSSVGKVVENTPWKVDIDVGSAKRMYGALTDILENPTHTMVNGVYQKGAGSTYSDAIRNAGKKSRAKFEVLEKSRIRYVFQTDDIRTLGEKFSNVGGMTPEVRDVLSSLPQHKEAVATLAQRNVLTSNNPRAALDEWFKRDPHGASFLFGNNRKELNQAVAAIERFNSSTLATVKANDNPINTITTLLSGSNRADVQQLIKQFGGKGSKGHEVLRASIMKDMVDAGLKQNGSGWTIDHKSLYEAAKKYRKNGSWNEVLTAADRTNINGIERYAKIILGSKSDVGVSLVTAQAVSNLKHPTSFIPGVREIGINKIIADILMRPKIVKGISGTGIKPISMKPFIGVPIILQSFGGSVFADPAVREYLGK